ncbi:gluconolactonase [Sphingomonas sp. SORGH_AS802]|uniref:SMP-30/gluconolactonase/LRE family protein n=1 Tax=unclassified Sphingomonas TaxID=196159 RepID=UPI00285DCBF2|nr:MULTISPECIES: SMP-30/gluconolactonase/LRE family protein [unclassified Sphingomonas]MDR6126431.1 gluconolactonase [Sphingomonas sp. SORGH_AS_0438]MDR6136261.1 gluconolactonase [Sphingomonas sp. SORGH_AS_0802]
MIDRRRLLAGGLALAGTAGWVGAAAEPVATLRRLSPKLDRMIAPDARIDVIARGIRWAEGPVWVPGGDYLLFSDPPANLVRRWDRKAGRVAPFLSPSGAGDTDPKLVREPGANGLALDHQGRLLIANSGGRSIDRLDLKTQRRETLIDRYQGKRFNSPNDLHVAKDGAIYFTDPPYGLADADHSPLRETAVNGVYRQSPDGTIDLIDGTLTRPNGIALSPDERQLYVSVSDDTAPRIMRYDLDAAGRPGAGRVWLDAKPMQTGGAPGLPDGMKVARDGTLVCSVPGGMMLLTPEAEPLGLIATGAPIANAAFGEGGRALFLTANDRVLRVPLRAGWQG